MIYLDNNATTKPLPAVQAEMLEYLATKWANPSSAHSFGLEAKAGVDRARRAIADLVGTESGMVVFTGSATEANNTAILSAVRARPSRRQIVACATEHSAVLAMGQALEADGCKLVLVKPMATGIVNLAELSEVINPETALVSVMWANNETGVINPVAEIAALCRARAVPFHCDAVQAAGKIPIDLRSMPVDYLTLSAHKLHGPKGIGALVVASQAPFSPMHFGGHQENGRRGGTENVPAIMGFAKAASLALTDIATRASRVRELRDRLEQGILEAVAETVVYGMNAPRLPNTTNIGFNGIDSDTLVSLLDQRGICVSSGSACMSDSVAPSHVILAMTGSFQRASEAIRFSLSYLNSSEEIERAIAAVKDAVTYLR